jgi:hypothetical protein
MHRQGGPTPALSSEVLTRADETIENIRVYWNLGFTGIIGHRHDNSSGKTEIDFRDDR